MLVDKTNYRCRCNSKLPAYLKNGWIDTDNPVFFAKNSGEKITDKLKNYMKEMNELKKLSSLYHSIPPSNFDFVSTAKDILGNKEYQITSDP